MSRKKKVQGSKSRPTYFTEIYEQMLADETKSFWDLSPVQNTLLGRTVSHVIFRTVGVSMANYFKEKYKNNENLPGLSESKNMADVAEMEFLSAWNHVHQTYDTLQMEALSFRALIANRDYQLWLAKTLSKIPYAQWDKQRARFTKYSGNPAYIVAFTVWRDTVRERKSDNPFSWLPDNLTDLEKYVLSRTVKGYELDAELEETVVKLKAESTKHGSNVMEYTQIRVCKLFSGAVINTNPYELGLTETGQTYYEHAGVLWGLWGMSLKQLIGEAETVEDVIPSLVNSLVNNYDVELYGRLRASYLSDWSEKDPEAFVEEDEKTESESERLLNEANTEIERLARELKQANNNVASVQKELQKQKDKTAKLEAQKASLVKQKSELDARLKSTQKKLNAAIERQKDVPVPTMLEPVTPIKVLEDKINTLECSLNTTNCRINDIYTLLSVTGDEDSVEESYDSTENNLGDLFDEAVKGFKGRIILNGGAKPWQDRVRKWFEDRGVKVRTYDLGNSVSGLRPTDIVVMNVIQNKHKYSVKFMNEVRSYGAKLLICNVNNIEQTLRIIFDLGEC